MGWTVQEKVLINFLLQLSGNGADAAKAECSKQLLLDKAFPGAIKLLNALLNSPYEKVIITDRTGSILFMNEAYGNIIAMDPADLVGKNVLAVLGNDTRMHIVGETLKPELHGLFRTGKQEAVARRMPLISNGNVLGVMGKDLFDNFSDLFKVAQEAKEFKHSISFFVAKEISGNQAKYGLQDIITNDPIMRKLKELIKRASATKSTIILQGETGVGKELFAHAIHQESRRRAGPFVSINCGAIPETLLESELFGYDAGAFTGASKGGKLGKFELANGGTIFLDEISEIPLASQVKILRVLQEKEVERVGGIKPVAVDVRVVASTNIDLWELRQQGRFREDLFYRLSVVTLTIPPLRERQGDLSCLVQYFLERYNREFNLQVKEISKKAMKQLSRYHWPGNVRELAAVIESAMNRIKPQDTVLDEFPLPKLSGGSTDVNVTLQETMDRHEKSAILIALNENDWHMDNTASRLKISPASLYRKIKKHGIRINTSTSISQS